MSTKLFKIYGYLSKYKSNYLIIYLLSHRIISFVIKFTVSFFLLKEPFRFARFVSFQDFGKI